MKELELASPLGPDASPALDGAAQAPPGAAADDLGCAFVVAALLHQAGVDACDRLRIALERDALVERVARSVLVGRRGAELLSRLFVPPRFREAWRDEALRLLEEGRLRGALASFDEATLVGITGAGFARLIHESERTHAAAILRAGEEEHVPMGSVAIDAVRHRMARAWVLERVARAIPAAFLLLAAAVAMGMLLRVLKLPG